jgi:hypothetical protein
MILASFCAVAEMHCAKKMIARKMFFIFGWGWKAWYSNLMPIVGIYLASLGC